VLSVSCEWSRNSHKEGRGGGLGTWAFKSSSVSSVSRKCAHTASVIVCV
jgi:hypothetical protein